MKRAILIRPLVTEKLTALMEENHYAFVVNPRANKVEIRQGDLFETDLSPADVVTLYLLPEINVRLRPILWRDLRVGARVVSHDFHMGPDWPSERTEVVGKSTIYSWTVRPEHKRPV